MEKQRHVLENAGGFFRPEGLTFSDNKVDILLPWIYQKEGRNSAIRVSEVHVQKKVDSVYNVTIGSWNSPHVIKNVGPEDRIRLVEGDFTFDDVALYGANTPACVANPEAKVCSR